MRVCSSECVLRKCFDLTGVCASHLLCVSRTNIIVLCSMSLLCVMLVMISQLLCCVMFCICICGMILLIADLMHVFVGIAVQQGRSRCSGAGHPSRPCRRAQTLMTCLPRSKPRTRSMWDYPSCTCRHGQMCVISCHVPALMAHFLMHVWTETIRMSAVIALPL